ncbi:MAG: hypothetical protein JWP88_306, partial [Flaviaesturariibacter sp.]|nr:hypothetical protein [Flaviaesturariibacter sp.]
MKHDFTNDELEDFLKSNSDRVRMRPSDAVWKGISDNLGKRRRRIGWFTSFFLVATSLTGYFLSQTTVRLIRPINNTSQAQNITLKSSSSKTTPSSLKSASVSESPLPAQPAISIPAVSRKRTPLRVVHKSIQAPALVEASANEVTEDVATAPASDFETTILDDSAPMESPIAKDLSLSATDDIDPLTIESVTNLQLALKKAQKLNVAFFFTPTVSYRKLAENKSYMNTVPQLNASPNYAALYNINDAVTHKPNIGLELGVSAKYPVANNIRLQGGVQFNMSRYDVKAFSNYSYQPATLALSSGTQTRPTNYSNFNGNNSDWLQNIYFQVSVPVGLEVKFGQSDKTQFGIASTVQPTYMLGDRVYLISSDYKNYVEVPWLMRRWNINTALETFVSYSTGKLAWQVGPQVRYQMLSSFVSKYPVKEHLFDFGLKVGVSLNQK